jgi:hypothetical protein
MLDRIQYLDFYYLFATITLLSIDLIFGLQDGYNIRQQALRTNLSSGVMGQHDRHLDTEDTLSHHDVSDGSVDVLLVGVTSLDHVSISELLGLGSLTTDLAGDSDDGSLGTGLHHEAEDTVARSAHGKAAQQLVLKGLSLGLGAQASVGHTLSEDLNTALREVESLLDDGGELSDSLALLTKHVLGLGGLDDDLGSDGGHTHLQASIAVLSQLTGEQLNNTHSQMTIIRKNNGQHAHV